MEAGTEQNHHKRTPGLYSVQRTGRRTTMKCQGTAGSGQLNKEPGYTFDNIFSRAER